MRCLVTGVAGFVGSHIAKRLLADGHEVVELMHSLIIMIGLSKSKSERSRRWRAFRFVEGNLVSMPLLSVLEGVDGSFIRQRRLEYEQVGVRSSLVTLNVM